jgi:ABC-type glutathione transport system ATPase component
MTTTAPDRSQRTATAIETDSLSRTFGEGDLAVHALVDVDLRIERGELVVLLGPSGSGKTTLLNLVGAIDQPTGGALRVDGIDLGGLDHEGRSDFRREHVGFVFQFFNLIPTLTARENVSLITEITRPGGDGDAAWASGTGWTTSRAGCPAVSSSGWPSPGPSPSDRRCSSATSPPVRSTSTPASRCSACSAGSIASSTSPC